MKTLSEYRANGAHAWLDGATTFARMADGDVLCFTCATGEFGVHEDPEGDPGWRFVAADIHWEGGPLRCAHCEAEIESAHGVPDPCGVCGPDPTADRPCASCGQ
jgi:hypothetical protein